MTNQDIDTCIMDRETLKFSYYKVLRLLISRKSHWMLGALSVWISRDSIPVPIGTLHIISRLTVHDKDVEKPGMEMSV